MKIERKSIGREMRIYLSGVALNDWEEIRMKTMKTKKNLTMPPPLRKIKRIKCNYKENSKKL